MDKETYMRRALQLARNGIGFASPNPMVGAVIVAPDGRVIGEGWHRRCGLGHAEVNAVASVADAYRGLLSESTMYVTLEPCSHYGKTPPCAKLIIDTGIPKVVVSTVDPFAKVAGRGIAMLREAGVDVEVGVLENESRELNRRFFTAHTHSRPFITLKWARSADGFMDWKRFAGRETPCGFSNPLTKMSTMRLRALHDAVLTTSGTVMADNSRLDVRNWNGRQPLKVLLDRNGRISSNAAIFNSGDAPLVYGAGEVSDAVAVFSDLYCNHGVTSVLVEAGPTFLGRLIESGLWDAAREEISPKELGEDGMSPAPALQAGSMEREEWWNGNRIRWYVNPS